MTRLLDILRKLGPDGGSRCDVDRYANVRFCEEDLLAPTIEGSFSIIRASNLLNTVHNGTLFRWSKGAFKSVAQVGAGGKIASLPVPDSDRSGIPLE